MKTSKHSGFTLTELMVGMAITGLLMAGVAQAFYANTQTFAVVSEQSVLQENGRLALQLIGNQMLQAGYLKAISPQNFYDAQSREEMFPAQTDVEFSGLNLAPGAIVGGLNNVSITNVRPGSDVLIVRYQKTATGDGVFRDCAGTEITESNADLPADQDTVTVGFFVDAEFTLRCVRADGDRVQLIDGVDDLQVSYGIDADGMEPVRADNYVAASDMTEVDWPHVVAVNVALLARPGASAITPPHDHIVRTYNVNDEVREFDDSVARSVYSQTFLLRNRSF